MNTNTQKLSSAYTTHVTIGLQDKVTAIAMHLAKILMLNKSDTSFTQIKSNIYALTHDQDSIDAFLHPIIYKNTAYIDVRPFTDLNGAIRNNNEYTLLVRRAILDLEWATNNEVFASQERFVVDAFASWFASGLARNTEVDLLTSTQFRITAAIYYLGIFHNTEHASNEDVILLLLKQLSQILRLPTSVIDDLITANEDAFVALYLQPHGDSKNRLAQFINILNIITQDEIHIDIGVIYNSICRGALIAANAVDLAAIAIEHPPMLMIMLMYVTQKSIQNNTTLGRAALGIMKKHDFNSFEKFLSEYK